MNDAKVPEVGILMRPQTLLGTAHGLTDLFTFANRLTCERTGQIGPALCVSHFLETDGEISRRDDRSSSDIGIPTIVIVPPRETIPLGMEESATSGAWLRTQHDGGATIASVCGGVFLLAQAGLLNDRSVTTHWACAEALVSAFPRITVDVDRMVINDGDVMTAGGMMAWADLGLLIVEKLVGHEAMVETARFMMVDPPRRQQSFYRHFQPRRDHGDTAVSRAQDRLHGQGRSCGAGLELAEYAGLEPRTFVRRFHRATGFRPNEYCQRLRIESARQRLETTVEQIGEIAHDVGYTDPASFRKIFARITGLSPGDYRRRFGHNNLV
jgi:transcriptional regulator GlxA family with amidase domain